MKKKLNNNETLDKIKEENQQVDFPGYPLYPPEDDIYYRDEKMGDVDPEEPSKKKRRNEIPDMMNEKDFKDDMSGSDLDVPGAELDDQQEDIGSEDEENNYYSLGGDNHEDLESDTREENEL
ncbi:hypothetical protein [Cytophaga aurantiaca]|uniref:hypothetical protein n=1 Tax=Cytophaga aurantiaca TaxID=29530 RepID=UPI0003775F66|nr:hypothetical protein [Cytophaga aurantiaca]